MHAIRKFTRALALFAAIILATDSIVTAAGPETSPEKEAELIAVLRSDKPAAEKAITCKLLAIHGSKAAVPELAKLLPDEQLNSWARTALEVIPGTEADAALRKAADSLQGNLLVGTINSIGVRRDAAAVPALAARLQDKDAEVASAAAVALGRIGNAAAAASLRKSLATAALPTRSAVAEGCVLCAERLYAAGKSAEATEIYDEVRMADVPKQRIIEATRGAILARNQAGIPLLLQLLRSEDKGLFQLGLGTAREFPGGEVDKALATEIAVAPPPRAALIVQVIADRKGTVALPALLTAAANGPLQVRIAAIAALGRVGDDSCLAVVLKAALEADAELAQAARATLADLQGEKVNAQLVLLLGQADEKNYALLIELVGQRRIDAVPALLKALDHADAKIRGAALTALGETVSLKELSVLAATAIAPKHPADAAAAQQALKAASIRMPDREACAQLLAVSLENASTSAKVTLLEILSEVGGTKALETIGRAAKSDAPELQDAGSRLLGKWNSVDASAVLLDLAKSAANDKYQGRALRGYISLARRFAMPEEQRAQMCQNALAAAHDNAERKLVLDVLKIHPSLAALKLAVKARQIPDLKDDAAQATLVIAQKLGGKGAEVGQILSQAGLEKVKLEIVKAEYGSGTTQKDVTAILQKQTGDLPLISLPSANYNANFGGDPLPGSVKKLNIHYRINGKSGVATFAEDALIILPMPK